MNMCDAPAFMSLVVDVLTMATRMTRMTRKGMRNAMIFSEGEHVELKSEITPDICKEIIAFANTHGGTIYVGVTDGGVPEGISNADESMLRISNMARDSIKPDVTMFVRYETINVDGKNIIAVTVQQGADRPYYLASKGLRPSGVYVRSGASAAPASETAIRRMIKDTDGDSFETMRSLVQDLTFTSAAAEFKKNGVDFDSAKMKTLGVLSPDGIYSNLGLLLSDQCPATVKAAAFSGTDQRDFQDRREFEGSLFRQMNDLYDYLELRNRTRASFDGLYRIDEKDYPEDAIREAMMNCLVHRDYSYSASTLVSVYDDRMEFVSIGGLPSGIAMDDIMLGLSVCRNPKLAAVFYRLNLIEAYGTGIPKIMRAYEKSGLKPVIETTPNAFKITLPNRNAAAGAAKPVTGAEEAILAYVREHGHITRRETDALLGVSQTTSSRILKRMTETGLIRQEGAGRRTKYTLK